MQTRQLWLEIKRIVHLIFIICVNPFFFFFFNQMAWPDFGSGLVIKIWLLGELSFLWPSTWASEFYIHPHSPTTSVFSWVESPHYDFALILLVILLFVFITTLMEQKKGGLRTALLHSALTSSVLKSESIKLDAAIRVFLKKKKCLHLKLVY